MPLSAGHWPLLDLLFLAWSTILPLLLLQVNKINSLFKVARKAFQPPKHFLDFSFSLYLFFHVLFFFPFHFTALCPKPCFSSWFGQNTHNSCKQFYLQPSRKEYAVCFSQLLKLIPFFLKAQTLSNRRVYGSTGEFTNWAVPIPWAHHKQEHPTAKL